MGQVEFLVRAKKKNPNNLQIICFNCKKHLTSNHAEQTAKLLWVQCNKSRLLADIPSDTWEAMLCCRVVASGYGEAEQCPVSLCDWQLSALIRSARLCRHENDDTTEENGVNNQPEDAWLSLCVCLCDLCASKRRIMERCGCVIVLCPLWIFVLCMESCTLSRSLVFNHDTIYKVDENCPFPSFYSVFQ